MGKADKDWGAYDGPIYEDQSWKLVPRFKPDANFVTIWSVDNLQGTTPVVREISVTTGLKLTSSLSISTTKGLKVSLDFSISIDEFFSAGIKTELTEQITKSLSHSEEKDWSQTTKVTFTAPPRTYYRVDQLRCDFSSPLDSDNCSLWCGYHVH